MKVSVVFFTATKNSSGKDLVANLFIKEIDKIKVDYDVVSLSTPVILSYMSKFNEGRFDFYKIHPEKRVSLLLHSSEQKQVDPFIFINQSIACIEGIIKDNNSDELFILIPDCRYLYEMELIASKLAIDFFYCINIHRMVEDVEEYSDREKQFEFPSSEKFKNNINGVWIELHNDTDIDGLTLTVDNIFKKMRLGDYAER
ncbi:MAG: hypothetical protein DRQ78_06605 [Epsilonproteobacteria bacterium]|nr:MAG: hypothetical protein DRQ78_06605 [Campylobacterota bacterium]